jgi:hypothetical protein
MPSEIRKLIFSSEEVCEVIVGYCLRKGRTLPNSRIDSILVQPDSNDFLIAKFEPEDLKHKGREEAVSFTKEQVAAALIMYCRARKIPLPRSAEKSLEGEGGGVSLKISIGVP